MLNELTVKSELETIEKLISEYRKELASQVPTGHRETPHYWLQNYYFKEKLNSKDFACLATCSHLDFLSGQKAALQFMLEEGVYKYREQKVTDISAEKQKDNEIPFNIQQAISNYRGLNRQKVTDINATLYIAYAQKNKSLIEETLLELTKYLKW